MPAQALARTPALHFWRRQAESGGLMGAKEEQCAGVSTLDVDMARCAVEDASVSIPAEGGLQFSLCFGPVSDELLTSLTDAARATARVRLVFEATPILVDLLRAERAGPSSVRLTGRVVPSNVVE